MHHFLSVCTLSVLRTRPKMGENNAPWSMVTITNLEIKVPFLLGKSVEVFWL